MLAGMRSIYNPIPKRTSRRLSSAGLSTLPRRRLLDIQIFIGAENVSPSSSSAALFSIRQALRMINSIITIHTGSENRQQQPGRSRSPE